MAKDRDIKLMIRKVNATMDKLEKFLNSVKIDSEGTVEVEKDRVSYKEGLVDGLCMMSWTGHDKDEDGELVDYVGKGDGKVLKDVLDEIGSVYGFDGKEEYKRVKAEEMEVTDMKDLVIAEEDLNDPPDIIKE